MRLWRLRVERFRGIAGLDWKVNGRVSCLVGAGDMAKTTILEAIGLLGTTWTAVFGDDDFYGRTVDGGPIVIEGTFGELPLDLLADNRFGLDLVGIDTDGNVHEEPGDHDPGLIVRLDIDHTLEPVWRVICARSPDGRPLTGRDRARLGITRLGNDPDRQFSLARGTALARAVTRSDDVGAVLATAYRQAREAVSDTDLSDLDTAIDSVAQTATYLGAGPVAEDLALGLELSRTTASGLILHSGGIPVRSAGLGTRRLVALGLELGSTDSTGILCIDEIEHGLEPHRIRHLVSTLSALVDPGDGGGPGGHVVYTSHSSVALAELGSHGVSVVHNSTAGAVSVRSVPVELTGVVRASPEALLAKKVVIGEGKTEVGLIRAHGPRWADDHGGYSLAHKGVAVVEGGGTTAPSRAFHIATLGYPTLLLADSDRPLDPPEAVLTAAGVTVVQWADGTCTEQRLLLDLSWDGVKRAFQAVVDDGRQPGSVIDALLGSPPGKAAMTARGLARVDLGDDCDSLIAAGIDEKSLREAFAAAATNKSNAWFKRIDSGEILGVIAIQDTDIPGSPFGKAIEAVEVWCHG